MDRLNWRTWKREHQMALAIAVALGCLVGLVVGLNLLDTHTSFKWGALLCDDTLSCLYLLNGYWLRVIGCWLFGGVVGAALIYIRQLLRT
jgi:H+/Cl- antiporter ClcA